MVWGVGLFFRSFALEGAYGADYRNALLRGAHFMRVMRSFVLVVVRSKGSAVRDYERLKIRYSYIAFRVGVHELDSRPPRRSLSFLGLE